MEKLFALNKIYEVDSDFMKEWIIILEIVLTISKRSLLLTQLMCNVFSIE